MKNQLYPNTQPLEMDKLSEELGLEPNYCPVCKKRIMDTNKSPTMLEPLSEKNARKADCALKHDKCGNVIAICFSRDSWP